MSLKKILLNLEEILTEYQRIESPNKLIKDFYSVEIKNKTYIKLKRHFNSIEKSISIKEILLLVEEKINDNSIVIELDNHLKIKKFVNLIFSEDINNNLKINLIKLIGSEDNSEIYNNLLSYIFKRVEKNKTNENIKELGKELLLCVIEKMPETKFPSIVSGSFCYIVEEMMRFDFEKKDYPKIHSFLNTYTKTITNDIASKNILNSFLKNNITPEDWKQFIKYDKKEKELDFKDKDLDFFSENVNAKLQLSLNKAAILTKYPKLSLSGDYLEIINIIIEVINEKKDSLNLKMLANLGDYDNKTELYFLSNKNEEIDKIKIKEVFFNLLQVCVDSLSEKGVINTDLLKKTIETTILSIDLKQQQTSIKKIKI